MAARPRILCIGNGFGTAVEELREAGFDVMLAPDAQAARALIHLYPPAAILGDHRDVREIHQKHPRIPAVLWPANLGRRISPQTAARKVDEILSKRTPRY